MKIHPLGLAACAALMISFVAGSVHAQSRFGDMVRGLKEKVSVARLTGADASPITTNLADATYGVPGKDGFEPSGFQPLTSLREGPQAPIVLRPGAYRFTSQSYCLHAGTYGPGEGDGYLYAPPLGSAELIVQSIARSSVNHPEISQRTIQQLLWAILARVNFNDMNPELTVAASVLLSPQDMAMLGRSTAFDFLKDRGYKELLDSASPQLRRVLDAQAQLNELLTTAGSTFEDVERAAVLTGMAPIGEGSQDIPRGRWSLHPDGYYVRYMPEGYSTTRLEIWVPEDSAAIGKPLDLASHIAVPGNTARQRLLQSAREK